MSEDECETMNRHTYCPIISRKPENAPTISYDLIVASSRGYVEIVRMLLEKGIDVNAQGGYDSNALYAASSRVYTQYFLVPTATSTLQDTASDIILKLPASTSPVLVR